MSAILFWCVTGRTSVCSCDPVLTQAMGRDCVCVALRFVGPFRNVALASGFLPG